MTPLREAFVLPGLFLTVTLLGGLRVGDAIRLIPPPLSAIVLAVVLVGALVRAGVLVPAALLDSERRPLENLSGAIVLLTLVAASAQAMNLVMPDRGLLHFAFAVFLFVQLISLSAAGSDRIGMLRSLFVLLGAAFVLRFIVLESLYAADGGALKRVLTSLMAGVTLGGLEYQPNAASTGYAAFVTLALYIVGLVLLPIRPFAATSALTPTVRDGVLVPLVILALMMTTSACSGSQGSSDPKPGGTPISADGRRAAERRDALLAAARVWMPPAVPPADADLGANPGAPDGFDENADVDCRFVLEKVGGLTPKFNCQVGDSTVVKVKYGASNGELPSEVAATRLLTALGFGADRMYIVRSVRCAGCPSFPYAALRCFAKTGLQWACFPGGINYEKRRRFDPVVIERRLEGRKIEEAPDQGWAWFELDKIDPARGGSPRAEVDALRLLAVFLAHWDNKGANQRLACLPRGDLPDGRCTRPFAMIQDVGAMFGPDRVDLHNWRNTRVWVNPLECRVSMKMLPYQGATFTDQQISEEGRLFLLRLIGQLSVTQVETLFNRSRFASLDRLSAAGRNPAAWAAAFLDKVQQIRDAGPCQSVVASGRSSHRSVVARGLTTSD